MLKAELTRLANGLVAGGKKKTEITAKSCGIYPKQPTVSGGIWSMYGIEHDIEVLTLFLQRQRHPKERSVSYSTAIKSPSAKVLLGGTVKHSIKETEGMNLFLLKFMNL